MAAHSQAGRVTLELDQGAKRQLQGIIKEKLSKISSYTDDVLPVSYLFF